MGDAESCSSRALDSLPAQSLKRRQKVEVYRELLCRLKESENEEASQLGFDDELWAHFNRLPVRYALDVNLERAEDVLVHKKLLHMAHDHRIAFEVRLVQALHLVFKYSKDRRGIDEPKLLHLLAVDVRGYSLLHEVHPMGDENFADSLHLNFTMKGDPQTSNYLGSIHPLPAFALSPSLEHAFEARASQVPIGSSGMSADLHLFRPLHEITISTNDKPKLLSQLTSLLSEIGLNIQEAHAFSTIDGYSLDVFVVDGWEYEVKLGNVPPRQVRMSGRLQAHNYLKSARNDTFDLNKQFNYLKTETEQLRRVLEKEIPKIEQKKLWSEYHTSPSNLGKSRIMLSPDHVNIPIDEIDVWEIDARLLKFEHKIAAGSFGNLYKGTLRGQDVAIKCLKAGNLNADGQREFAQEVYILRKVRHKNVVQFIGACTRAPNLCIVTEFMSGGSVYDFLHKQNGFFKLPTTLKVAIDVSKGMNYLHQNNIIHRDLKAANLLMDENEVVKVADFGVARVQAQSGVMTAETGTYRWMAPEVIEHRRYDHKADVFSFGIVLWELLTGKLPYENLTPLQAAVGVVRKGLRPTIPTHAHPKIVELLKRCWQPDPSLRPEFSEIIKILQHIAMTVVEEERPGKRRNHVAEDGYLLKREENEDHV